MNKIPPLLFLVCFTAVACAQPVPFQKGDRVVLLGNTMLERAQRYGHLETAWCLAHPDLGLSFRNIAWSAETVEGESRAYFGTPADGYKLRLNHLDLAKPTLLIVNYGANAAFEGEAGLERFIAGYGNLLDDLAPRIRPTEGPRTKHIVLLGVPPLERTEFLDPEPQNQRVAAYNQAIAKLAAERGLVFVDVAKALEGAPRPLTDNGMHFTDEGYRQLALALAGIDTAPAAELREAVRAKNALFFHQYRPQNETYLRGFRKHEQGRNAAELAQFDPLLEEADDRIRDLARSLSAKEVQ